MEKTDFDFRKQNAEFIGNLLLEISPLILRSCSLQVLAIEKQHCAVIIELPHSYCVKMSELQFSYECSISSYKDGLHITVYSPDYIPF